MNERSKTITWQDPMIGARAMATMSGLDYMRALQAGQFPPPPILGVMNLDLVSVDVGTVTFTA